jgi:hypothetical protein
MTWENHSGSTVDTGSLHEQARNRLLKMSHLKGARTVLRIMPAHHDGIKPEGDFSDYSEEYLSPGFAGGMIYEEPIPMTDNRALAEYKSRSKKLIDEIEADLQLGHIKEAEEKQAEFDQIRKHILEVTTHDGRIKNFPTEMIKNYQRVYQDFRYLLKRLKVEDPEVYHYLKIHVRTGTTFKWIPSG